MLLKASTMRTRTFFLGGTGLTPNVTLSKNGGAFAAASGSVSELANGWYSLPLDSADTNTEGDLAYHFDAGTFQDFIDQVVGNILPALTPADVQAWGGGGAMTIGAGGPNVQCNGISDGKITGASIAESGAAKMFEGAFLTEAYSADGATATPAQLLYMIWSALSEFAISGATMTCKKLDGTTTSMTFTLSPAGNPTSRARSA